MASKTKWCSVLITFLIGTGLLKGVHAVCEAGQLPGPVNNLRTRRVLDNSLTIEWDKITENPDCLSSYSVCFRTTWPGFEKCETLSSGFYSWGSESNVIESCTTYTIVVAALDPKKNRGQNSTITITTAPDRVSSIEVLERTHDTMLVSWKPTSWCVEQYAVSWCSPDLWTNTCPDPPVSVNVSMDATQYLIRSVNPCTRYRVTVSAYGLENAKADTSIVNTTNYIMPRPVRNVRVVLDVNGLFYVFWDSPEVGESCVDYYYSCYQRDYEDDDHCGVSYNTSFSMKRKTMCTSYSVHVSVKSKNGESSTNVTTYLTTVPGPVENVTVFNQSNAITISWNESLSNSSCVQYYEVSWCPKTETSCSFTSTRVLRGSYQLTVSGLEACTTYFVLVTAVGPGSIRSSQVNGTGHTTVSVPPGQVTNPSLDVQSGMVTLTWSAPSVSAVCVNYYSICLQRTGSSEEWCYTRPTNRLTWSSSTQLVPSTQYAVVIAAVDFEDKRAENTTLTFTAV